MPTTREFLDKLQAVHDDCVAFGLSVKFAGLGGLVLAVPAYGEEEERNLTLSLGDREKGRPVGQGPGQGTDLGAGAEGDQRPVGESPEAQA